MLGPRLLPHRAGKSLPPNLSEHARTLAAQYVLHAPVARFRVPVGHAWEGRTLDEIALPEGVDGLGVEEVTGRPRWIAAWRPATRWCCADRRIGWRR